MPVLKTLDTALRDYFESQLIESVGRIDVETVEVSSVACSRNIDEVISRHLGQTICDKIANVDVDNELLAIGGSSTTQGLQVYAVASGKWLYVVAILFAMVLAVLLVGADTAMQILEVFSEVR